MAPADGKLARCIQLGQATLASPGVSEMMFYVIRDSRLLNTSYA